MCRMLIVRGTKSFFANKYLESFSAMCERSKVFQGDGFGIAMRTEKGGWRLKKGLSPIWETNAPGDEKCDWLIAHARAACLNDDVAIENNMPFRDGGLFFAFNGELRGVRIKAPGQTGAHKIFNYIKRFSSRHPGDGLKKAAEIIIKRTDYVKALNILMTDNKRIYGYSHYSEDPDYFTIFKHSGEELAFCSQPLDGRWKPLDNGVYFEE